MWELVELFPRELKGVLMNLVHELPVARQKEWPELSLLIIGLLPVDLNTGQPDIILMTLLIIKSSCQYHEIKTYAGSIPYTGVAARALGLDASLESKSSNLSTCLALVEARG